MRTVGSRELKNRLGRYLGVVKKGGAILVTDRGKPVARLMPASDELNSPSQMDVLLRQLEAEGHVRLAGKPGRAWKARKLIRAKGKPASQMIIEDRR
jgi:prevent-host-death family protein